MLRGIRKASSNWLGKTIMTIAMGALIVSFGVWGIADIFRGFGQSTLAKVGHTEINRLRDKAKAALGPKYDLRLYDDLVVKTGAVPLTVLADTVDGYIKAGGVANL